MGTPPSAKIIQEVDMVLKALEMVYHTNWTGARGVSDRTVHRQKVVVEW